MRIAPLTGLVAVVFTVIGFLLFGDTPAYDAPGRQVRFYYSDHQGQLGVGLYFLVVAAVLFVFFAAHLARLVRDIAPGDGWLHPSSSRAASSSPWASWRARPSPWPCWTSRTSPRRPLGRSRRSMPSTRTSSSRSLVAWA
ncbi:hypothetical protein OG806_12365 [Streptomyces sp. NBC_00882]|uniref:hypothetical protein n=1 Tax=Streptomyces sp. NBC_00882 TaxID=2975856 RepID=UPI00386FD7C4|nr:hypothetical protein OG806_12365 [Streptomyces sp. NBC_00882]